MPKPNSECVICGKEYYVCLSCPSGKLNTWKKHTDTSEHYKIFQILRGYNNGVFTKEEAKERLKNIDLSDLNELKTRIIKQINEIFS